MRYLIVLLVFIAQAATSQHVKWTFVKAPVDANFRAVSVVDDHVAWVSGSNGWTGHTRDGGKTWTFGQIKNFEKWDFRTLFAFNNDIAVVANAGSPAYILRTTDGGL